MGAGGGGMHEPVIEECSSGNFDVTFLPDDTRTREQKFHLGQQA